MKKSILGALVTGAVISLLALTGCDTPVGDGIWLDETANPLVGTWGLPSNGMTVGTSREFRNDGTFTATTTSGETTTTTDGFYLVKDDFFVLTYAFTPFYLKFKFTVIDNNTISVLTDAATSTSYQTWVREGEENPNENRTITLSNGLDGFWRSDRISFRSEEYDTLMYDYFIFSKNGTFRMYHYMDKDRYYLDRGAFSYFIDNSNANNVKLIAMSDGYTVRVYYNFTKSNDNAFSWATTSGGTAAGLEKFDGEAFWRAPIQGDPFNGELWQAGAITGDGLYERWDFTNNSNRLLFTRRLAGEITTISSRKHTYTLSANNTIVISPSLEDGVTGTSTFTYTFGENGDRFTVNGIAETFKKWDWVTTDVVP